MRASKLASGGITWTSNGFAKGYPGMTQQDPPPDTPQADTPDPEAGNGTLYHLGYVSTETDPFTNTRLVELLEIARRVNGERNVTGLLLYREGSFYQVLEGSETDVKRTFADIERDPGTKRFKYCSTAPPTYGSSPTGRWGL